MDMLGSGLVRLGMESMVVVSIVVGGLHLIDESMPDTISEDDVSLAIPESALKLR